jgi:hypothetical protein
MGLILSTFRSPDILNTLPQAGKLRSKLRTSCTNKSTSKPGTPQRCYGPARRGANIVADHMLVVIKLRTKICRTCNTKPQQLKRFAVERLKDRDVASR